MRHEYDGFEHDNGHGGNFVMGLLAGAVLGAGLAMLFAPKRGAELRSQISDQAGTIANTASRSYRRATETASEWADRSREAGQQAYDKTRHAVNKGKEEAERYVRDAASEVSNFAERAAEASTHGTSAFDDRRGY